MLYVFLLTICICGKPDIDVHPTSPRLAADVNSPALTLPTVSHSPQFIQRLTTSRCDTRDFEEGFAPSPQCPTRHPIHLYPPHDSRCITNFKTDTWTRHPASHIRLQTFADTPRGEDRK